MGFFRDLNPSEQLLLEPLLHYSLKFYTFVALLGSIVALGAYAYFIQLQSGLAVTAMRNNVLWGLYITNFVFFIGISHVGALMSAILRLSGAEWRHPITRMAEAITFCSLVFGALMPIVDLGRPDRILNLLLYGRIQSPILWDMISITTYLIGSSIFLLLPLIPDIAMLRDRVRGISRVRMWLYRKLSLDWKGSPDQRARLDKAINTMTILILPIAISVHTVVSWIFGMTLRTGWNSTIFGPYFVAGALFSGVASVMVAMALFRRFYHLESFITLQHFKNMAKILLVLDLGYVYFTISEYLTVAYKWETSEGQLLESLFTGTYAIPFLFVQLGGLITRALLLAYGLRKGRHPVLAYAVAGTLVTVTMWIKRFVIVVPSLAVPQMGASWGSYNPSWVEWSITAAAFAGFVLLYTVFSRIFPIVSVWETEEAAHDRGRHGPTDASTEKEGPADFWNKSGETRP